MSESAENDFLDRPVFWEPSLAFLQYAIILLMVGAGGSLAALLLFSPDQTARVAGPLVMLLLSSSALILLLCGRIELATGVLALGVWLVATGIALTTGGVRSVVVLIYPMIIVCAGWLLGRRMTALLTLATIAAIVALVSLEMRGSLPQQPLTHPLLYGIVQVCTAVFGAIFIVFLMRSYQNRLTDVRLLANSLKQRTNEVQLRENDLNRAQAVAHIGSWVYDLPSDRIQLSSEACRIFALPEGSTASFADYVARTHRDDRSALIAAWQIALQERMFEHEHRIFTEGAIRWVRQKAELESDIYGVLQRAIGTIQDVTQRKQAEEKIERLAYFDALTGLPNRQLLRDRLQQALAGSARSGELGALLFIDLDDFKALNDTLGHDMGDLLLRQVAQQLLHCVRECDTVARLGGDEFVILLEDLGRAPEEAARQAEMVGEKIALIFSQDFSLDDQSFRSTSSIGVALFKDHQVSVDELLKRADLAMYRAKADGRNAMRFFDPEMQAVVTMRVRLEADLRQGWAEKQFFLHYQAQVDREGRLTGAEALLRWQHPERGLVLPADFVPVIEKSGLILPLGQWVLAQACEQLARWADDAGKAHLTMAVNLSAHQFYQPDFVDQILKLLDSHGVAPGRLELELTESVLLDDVEAIIEKMGALKAHGVRFSLDDFGTGYSSLAYLKRLPLDQLKIDRSFVRDLLTDANDAAIARTIVALADSLGLAVIAEGVENAEQRDVLAAQGCFAYQGYYFGRPGAVDDLPFAGRRVSRVPFSTPLPRPLPVSFPTEFPG